MCAIAALTVVSMVGCRDKKEKVTEQIAPPAAAMGTHSQCEGRCHDKAVIVLGKYLELCTLLKPHSKKRARCISMIGPRLTELMPVCMETCMNHKWEE